MIITKRTVGLARRGSMFINPRVLITSDPGTYSWTLTNDRVSFNFVSDEVTGVRLDSFFSKSGSKIWENKSRTLWVLNVLRSIRQHSTTSAFHALRSDIYPTKATFVPPSVVPTQNSAGVKTFSFVWQDINYNKDYTNLMCSVALTVTLANDEDSAEFALKVSSRNPISSTVTGNNSVTITSVYMPKFIFKGTGDEAIDKHDVFSAPIQKGFTVNRPYFYMRSVRTVTESIHYDPDRNRMYHSGQPAGVYPKINLYRGNYACPGLMTIPCIVYGNREDKEGFLIFGRDPDGLHAKGWQWFSDDKGFHIRTYDKSDSETSPFGMGGIIPSDYGTKVYLGNRTNQIGWKLRIRPFVSPSRWVDWYGYDLYRREEVPVLEEYGWIPKSFYERYQDSEIDLRAIESPIVFNVAGHLSGDTSDVLVATSFMQEELKTLTSPPKEYTPQFPIHHQTVSLNSQPQRNYGNPTGVLGNYFGWESWANQLPLGTNYGPSGYKSPDFLPVNNFWSGTYSQLAQNGTPPYMYLVFPYGISAYSDWCSEISGIDLVSKTYLNKDTTYTDSDYISWSNSSAASSASLFNDQGYISCLAPQPCYDKHVSIMSGLVQAGVGVYHDTAGNWGRGCYASSHKYYVSGVEKTVVHPPGSFTHYYNSQQAKWLTASTNIIAEDYQSAGLYDSDATYGYPLSRSSEFPSDACLSGVPVSLYYGYGSPFFITYVTVYGSPRRDAVNQYNAGSFPLLSVAVQAPNWAQKCPGFSIVYGDRSVFNCWAWPNIGNIIDLTGYFRHGDPSGLSALQETVFYPQTQTHLLSQWAAWLATDIGMLKRVSVSYIASEFSNYANGYSGLSEDLSGIFYSANWSPFYDFTKQYLRVGGYEPDYIWHGSLEHPLDHWSVNKTVTDDFARGFYGHSAQPSLEDADYTGLGNDCIVHNVYRKRDSESILISLLNWYSGTETFSSTFDPLTYNISGGYEVYDLDVSSVNHGTKTLLAVKGASETYSISYSLSALQVRNLEIVSVGDILNSTLYQDLAVTYLPIAYSYAMTELSKSSLAVPYSYGTSVHVTPDVPLQGYKAASTQQIVNNLPQWTAIRQLSDSRGWKLVNSWGMGLEDLITNTAANLSDVWLTTADISQRSKISKTDIDSKEILEVKSKNNLLFNSSFSIKDTTVYKLPAGWTDLGKSSTIELTSTSVITPFGISLNEDDTIGQYINLDDQLVSDLVGSVYINANTYTTAVYLHVIIETTDGTVKNYSASITSRSENWKRLVLPITGINARVRRVKFLIKSYSSDTIIVAAPMLSTGNTVTPWGGSYSDGLPYIQGSPRFNIVQAIASNGGVKIPLFSVNDNSELTKIQIPTRVERMQSGYTSLDPFTTSTKGRKVDFFKEVYDVIWTVSSNLILEKSSGPSDFDYFGSYTIRDLRFFDANTYGSRSETFVSSSIQAATVRSGLLLTVVEQTYKSNTKLVLKVVIPRTPPNGATYLESVVDFDLGLDLSFSYSYGQLTETISSIATSETDASWIILTTSIGRKIYYKLYFDYYYFDTQSNQMYTLENYNGFKLQVL